MRRLGNQSNSHSSSGWRWLVVALFTVLMTLQITLPAQAQDGSAASTPTAAVQVPNGSTAAPGLFQSYAGVEDKDRYFTNAQRSSLAGDIKRLAITGNIPTLLVVRESADTPDQSLVYARATRTERGIESSEGADDGLVLLLTFPPGEKQDGYLVFSNGENTFPKGAMDEAMLEKINQERILPRFAEGRFYVGVQAGLREIFYQDYFFADPQQPLTGIPKDLQGLLNIAMPLAGIAFLGTLIMLRIESRNGQDNRVARRLFVIASVAFIAAAVLLGVYAHSRWTIGAGIGVALLLGIFLLSGNTVSRSRRRFREIQVRPLGTPSASTGGARR